MNTASVLKRKAMRLEDLPALPVTFKKVVETTEDDTSDTDDLAMVISSDQALTSKILKLANSAYYGYMRQIATINQAVFLLGFDTVRSVSLSIAVLDSFFKELPRQVWERLWLHALACASATRIIGDRGQETRLEEIYFAGLLHDIGKAALLLFLGQEYVSAVELAKDGLSMDEAERRLFDMDHCEVGGRLAERWHFPGCLVEPILFHHRPLVAEVSQPKTAATVHLADYISKKSGMAGEDISYEDAPVEESLEALGIGHEEMEGMEEEFRGQEASIREMLAIFS
jgi:HD-like signal output (HDOD) protein